MRSRSCADRGGDGRLTSDCVIDTSAWVRLRDPGVPAERLEAIADAIGEQRIWATTILLLEDGYSAHDAPAYHAAAELLGNLPFVELDADASRRARDIQRQLVRVGHHRMPPHDILTMAIAETHRLGVLHYDKHFDVIRDHTDCLAATEWLVPRGSL